jgi:putative membrane protein
MQVFLVFALLIALVAVVFAVQNTAIVTVSFLVWNFNNSLAVIILLTIFTGVLISILMSAPGWIKNRLSLANLRKKNKELETKLKKEQENFQAAQQELELYKNPPTPVEPAPPLESASNPEAALSEVDGSAIAPASEPYPSEPSAKSKEPDKKSKFPWLDRIFKL